MPLLPFKQGSPEWYDARRGKVTASVAAAILGVGPNGWLWAYNQICGEGQADNRHMAWGREHEAEARLDYEVASGYCVEQTGFWVHPQLDWLGASPDGLINDDGLVEIKCPGEVPSEVPAHHAIQMRVQLACTERKWCDYYVWTTGVTFCAALTRDLVIEASILGQLAEFYETYVRTNTPPPRRRPCKS